MTKAQWQNLLDVIQGETVEPLPVGFIIDSPWLPGWAGMSTMDYFTSETFWLEANLKAHREFPDILFLPGFWAEFGMCTEPSAFGAKCIWRSNDLPHAERVLRDVDQIKSLRKPDPRHDGLLPFVLQRLLHAKDRIEQAGHAIRFAVSRGPLNIASFLMGNTEFLMALRLNPEETHKLLATVTDFIIDWLEVQRECFNTIDGIFLLDDIIGFLGEDDFRELALPYLKRIYGDFDVPVKFLHNDAPGIVSAPYLPEIGVNLFNCSFEHSIGQMKELTQGKVVLLGNLPPRDVLAQKPPDAVEAAVRHLVDNLPEKRRIILSCGGGMPPNVSTANVRVFCRGAQER